jgi:hypothetical protein
MISPEGIRLYRKVAIGVACASALFLFIIAKNFFPNTSWVLLIVFLLVGTLIVWAITSYFLFRNRRGLPVLSDEEQRAFAEKNMTHLVVFAENATSQQIDNFSRVAMAGKKNGGSGEAHITFLTRFLLNNGRRAFAFRFSDEKSAKEQDLAVAMFSSMPGVQTVERGFERIADT